MKVSVIIPVLNEAKNIRTTIELLESLNNIYEVIFSDGGSTDGTLDIIPESYKVVISPRGRGIQLNRGAAIAEGEALLFLHSDSILSSEAIASAVNTLEQGFIGGCFSLSFDRKGLLLSLIAYLSNLRVKLFKVMFGDQGIFIRRDVFENSGGFPEIPIMEDLEFSLKLKRLGSIKQVRHKITTSARRFEKNGVLRTIMFMHKMKILYFLGRSPEELYQLYRDVR